jgi:hypothetical protein
MVRPRFALVDASVGIDEHRDARLCQVDMPPTLLLDLLSALSSDEKVSLVRALSTGGRVGEKKY